MIKELIKQIRAEYWIRKAIKLLKKTKYIMKII